VFHLDQSGLGYLVASFAAGSLIGSLLLSHVGSTVRLTRLMMAASSLWYVMLLVFAQAPTPLWAILFLIMAGLMQSFSMVPLQITLLREAGQRFRGRVMGVRMMAIYSLPLGLLAAGPLISQMGYRGTATIYAAIGLLFTLVISLRWRTALWRS
jgi:predicted MFS family arabinose efflux permease